jgi:hypothetical protein
MIVYWVYLPYKRAKNNKGLDRVVYADVGRHLKQTDRTVKNLTWKLMLPLTLMSFATFTKWWYVLPVAARDTMMTGFPLPFVCEGWHTSMSLQIFMAEFLINLFYLLVSINLLH